MNRQTSNYEQATAISQQFISVAMCNDLITKFNHELTPIVQKEYRSVLIKNIDIDEILNLKKTVLAANNQIFNFNLHEDNIECFFAKYSDGMHYEQLHLDCIAGPLQRKLSFSLLLNNDFEGGEFELLNPPGITKVTGTVTVFPSYLPHRITRVTCGVRYAIFGWIYGPHYV